MIPDFREIPKQLFDSGAFDLHTEDGQAAYVDAVVSALHAKDPRFGHLRKKKGQTQIHGHGEDSALYLSDVPGQSQAVDFISGAGGTNPQPGWQVDAPSYSYQDWIDPTLHGDRVTVQPVKPPYPGDPVFDAVGVALFADYARAGNAPDPQMGRWFGRVIYDWLSGNVASLEASVAKHRAEWKALLGIE